MQFPYTHRAQLRCTATALASVAHDLLAGGSRTGTAPVRAGAIHTQVRMWRGARSSGGWVQERRRSPARCGRGGYGGDCLVDAAPAACTRREARPAT